MRPARNVYDMCNARNVCMTSATECGMIWCVCNVICACNVERAVTHVELN